jgi:hypothetical protein
MALLDRFRPLPASRHADPEVRLAYVNALTMGEREALAAAAREDASARVRRAAVAKVIDPTVLGAVARTDADEGVRAAAESMLRDVAVEAFAETSEADSLAAVEALAALSGQKIIAQIAKTAARETVARRALDQTVDERSLSAIARQAGLPSIREAAFARLTGGPEVLAVAMTGEFKDTALLAVERLTDRADLERVAAAAKNKVAAKRARGIIRGLDEQVAREAAAARAALQAEQAAVRADQEEAARRAEERAAQERDAELARQAADEARRRDEQLASERAAAQAASEMRALEESERHRRALVAAAAVEQEARRRREALQTVHALIGRAEALAHKDDCPAKTVERAVKDLRAALSSLPPLPSKQDHEDVAARLRAALAALAPKLEDLRALDDWQRWANLGVQEGLCSKMEALQHHTDIPTVAREVHELQRQWRTVATVPRAQSEALWRRFKAAHDTAWARCEAHFAAQTAARAANLALKIALCERVEALADSTAWLQTAEEIKKLQAEWKTIGPASTGSEQSVWERFRLACDRFFTRRHDDLVRRKVMWAENLAKKEALCAAAETLAESTDWDATASAIKALQGEWKTIGPVRKNRSDAIWQRFRGACDRFFARYAQRYETARAERLAARNAVCVELETLAGTPAPGVSSASTEAATGAEGAPSDLVDTVRALRSRWQQELTLRGVDPVQAAALDQRFAAAYGTVLARWPAAFAGTDFDPDANRRRLEALVQRVEALVSSMNRSVDGSDGRDPASLAARLKEALAANTIGVKADLEGRWRAARDDVRDAQANWSRIGPVPDQVRRALAERFLRACRLILEKAG